jgi:translation initiation factor IF-3
VNQEKDRMHRVNDQIRFSPVVVINQDGRNLGALPLQKAKDIAFQSKLDLVEIAPNSKPPVCRIMDYGKFKFDQAIKDKKQRKKQQKQSQTKEIRLSPSIQDHDLETKIKLAMKFLKSDHKVHVKLEFKRREQVHQNIGFDVINNFVNKLQEYGNAISKPKSDGRNLFCLLEPKDDSPT